MKAPAAVLDAQRRYEIAPQMRDYDLLEDKVWLPYLMTFHRSLQKTRSFTTDEQGFRSTLWEGKPLSWKGYNEGDFPRGALIGASTAFGVGTTSDAQTLPSLLNQAGGTRWFNFAGRAFNSTQELLVFLLHLPRDVGHVLLFTGLNNLVLSFLSESASPVYNSFYAQSVFERGLQAGEVTGVQGSFRLLMREISRRLSPSSSKNGVKPAAPQDAYDQILTCFRRDMRLWSLLGEAMGFRLYFVFQPMASWIKKELSPQEQELFSLLDEGIGPPGWAPLSAYLERRNKDYIADVRGICQERQVPFLDLNRRPELARTDWLFVDRAHLTDLGTRRVSEIVREEFSL